MWEKIQQYCNDQFKILNIKNVYLPLLITETNLNIEKNHLEGFKTEVAGSLMQEIITRNKMNWQSNWQ